MDYKSSPTLFSWSKISGLKERGTHGAHRYIRFAKPFWGIGWVVRFAKSFMVFYRGLIRV